jgi:hypothetical protein
VSTALVADAEAAVLLVASAEGAVFKSRSVLEGQRVRRGPGRVTVLEAAVMNDGKRL